jgi:hypothetical protein
MKPLGCTRPAQQRAVSVMAYRCRLRGDSRKAVAPSTAYLREPPEAMQSLLSIMLCETIGSATGHPKILGCSSFVASRLALAGLSTSALTCVANAHMNPRCNR